MKKTVFLYDIKLFYYRIYILIITRYLKCQRKVILLYVKYIEHTLYFTLLAKFMKKEYTTF